MKNKLILKKLTTSGILAALASIAFIIESLFPPLFIPGARMGISNIFILLGAIILEWQYGYGILIVKILIGSLFSGNLSAIMYSLPAGIIALTLQILLLNLTDKLSLVSISVLGAVANNLIQNSVFCLVTNTVEFFVYFPYLALIGIISGLLVGFTVFLLVKKLPPFITEKKFDYKTTTSKEDKL